MIYALVLLIIFESLLTVYIRYQSNDYSVRKPLFQEYFTTNTLIFEEQTCQNSLT